MYSLPFKHYLVKGISSLLIFAIFVQTFAPLSAYALTSGPSQPEFSSFEPVATNSMVNEFSGDFNYNLPVIEIPGAHGGGYAMSLSYHAGASPEEDASWVGYGWTLNPGAINRSKRGFADDADGEPIKYWNKAPMNWTVSVGATTPHIELFTANLLSGNGTIRYNNYRGFALVTGFTLAAAGVVTLSTSYVNGVNQGFSLDLNPGKLLQGAFSKETAPRNNESANSAKKGLNGFRKLKRVVKRGLNSLANRTYSTSQFFDETGKATVFTPFKGANFNVSLSGTLGWLPVDMGGEITVSGGFNYQKNKEESSDKTYYGYMYSAKAETGDKKEAIMDYMLERDGSFQKRDKFLPIPYANYDYFSSTGEGITGSFRLQNKRIGHFRPNYAHSVTYSASAGIGLDAMLGTGAGPDFSVGVGRTDMWVKPWKKGDIEEVHFASPDDSTEDEPVFFRYSNDMGGFIGRGNVQTKASATASSNPSLPSNEYPRELNGGARAGRSTYIGYNTNEDMMETSPYNNKYIKSYNLNDSSRSYVERGNISKGIGEFVTYNESGMCYTYGLPVYSRNEARLSFGLHGVGGLTNNHNYLVYGNLSTSAQDANNIKTISGEENTNPYASTYLLTAITSPDYLDKNLDGPTDDDYGGWTRFTYDRKYGTDNKKANGSWYRWRVPYTGFYYDRGDLTDIKDDKGSVSYGEKEVYYLDSIVTRTHIAIFVRSQLQRLDGLDAALENQVGTSPSAKNNASARGIHKLDKLDKIILYAKDDPSKPVKTVHFEYDYSSFPNTPNTVSGTSGKLTLKKVWFEYNQAVNAKISPYVFH